MAWGTPTSRATLTDTAAPTSAPITGVTVAQGSLILVAGGLALDSATVTVSDSVGNTYTVVQGGVNTTSTPDCIAFLAYATAATALSGGTITVAWGGGTADSVEAEVFEVTGGRTLDSAVTATGANTSATATPSIGSGTPSVSGELLLGVGITQTANPSYTEDTGNGWTSARAQSLQVIGLSMCLHVSYQVVADTSTKTYAPTTANATQSKLIVGFKPATLGAAAQAVAAITQSAAGVKKLKGVAAQTIGAITQEAFSRRIDKPRLGDIETAFVRQYGPGLERFDVPAFFEEVRQKRAAAKLEKLRRWPAWNESEQKDIRLR